MNAIVLILSRRRLDAAERNAIAVSRAFTLVELLVVLSLIAMLIALLIPALSQARVAAKIGVCGSNQRQIGIAEFTYAGDSKNWLIPNYLAGNGADYTYAQPSAGPNFVGWLGSNVGTYPYPGNTYNSTVPIWMTYLSSDGRGLECPDYSINRKIASDYQYHPIFKPWSKNNPPLGLGNVINSVGGTISFSGYATSYSIWAGRRNAWTANPSGYFGNMNTGSIPLTIEDDVKMYFQNPPAAQALQATTRTPYASCVYMTTQTGTISPPKNWTMYQWAHNLMGMNTLNRDGSVMWKVYASATINYTGTPSEIKFTGNVNGTGSLNQIDWSQVGY